MNAIDATVFVYRHKEQGLIECAYLDDAVHFQNDSYEHVATLNPLAWIELHYDEVKEDGFRETVFTGLMACKLDQLQAFANLIRKEQIEIDAGICDSFNWDASDVCAEAIRNQELDK